MNILLPLLRQILFPILAILLLAGCSGSPERPSDRPTSLSWPALAAPEAGETIYRIDSSASQLRIRVDPEGPMARLGHSHVVGGSVVNGTVILGNGQQDARIDLQIDASSLEVDRPEWRAAEGLKPDLDQAAISGTRANMRGERLLHVEKYPEISVRSTGVSGPDWLPDVTARIRLRGTVREVVVPVSVERTERRLVASGAVELFQSDFGIEPFSTAGGALRVSDRMRIRFRIVAEKAVPH